MQEAHVAGLERLVTGDQVPAAMAIVALTPFADFDRRLDLKALALPAIRIRIDEVRMLLMRVVLVGTIGVEGVTKDIRDEPTEIVALNVSLQWPTRSGHQMPIDAMNHEHCLVGGRLQLLHGQLIG